MFVSDKKTCKVSACTYHFVLLVFFFSFFFLPHTTALPRIYRNYPFVQTLGGRSTLIT